jgi:chitinase
MVSTGRAGTWSASATALSDRAKDSEAFVRSHVRRLEALRRAGHVERIDADHWKILTTLSNAGRAMILAQGGYGLRMKLRLEAESALLRRQLNVLRRKLHGRVPRTMIACSLSSCFVGFHHS